MKKAMKVFSVLMIVAMLTMAATPVLGVDFDNATKNLQATNPENVDNMTQLVSKILGFLQWFAIIGGILIITILGIKYMMGSLEEKAEYKKSLIPLIVGIIVVMGATTIANILFKTFTLNG